MKKLTLFAIFIFGLFLQTSAQSRIVEESFVAGSESNINLDFKFGDIITVKSWDKNEISFRAEIEINSGKLNDALTLDFRNDNGILHIDSDFDEQIIKEGRRKDCPDQRYKQYNLNSDGSDGDDTFICSKIKYEIFIPANSNVTVESISADIELVDLSGPIRAKSISGFVDLSRPAGKPADIELKTVSGEAYTDIDELQFENRKDHIPLVGYKLSGKIGSGGHEISLESVSGNIYLRKGQ